MLVRPFPDVENGRVQVTVDGGYSPAWSSDGTDLFYRDRTGRLIAAHTDTTDGFRVMSVEPLSFGSEYEASTSWRRYDVHPDGERFVMIRQEGDELILVDNWFEELRGLFEAR